MKVIPVESSLHVYEEPSQKPESPAAHSDEARYRFQGELLVRQANSGRRPSFFKQFLDLRCAERTELTYQSKARVELRKTGGPLLFNGNFVRVIMCNNPGLQCSDVTIT